MTIFINGVISSIIEIVLLAIIPFIWWLVTARKQEPFPKWLGLKKCDFKKNKTALWTLGVSLGFLLLGVFTIIILRDVETAASTFTGLGAQAIPAIIVYAVFNTSFPEEFFFRGFLLKRLESKLPFAAANTIQALLFGLLHGVMFFIVVGAVKAILIIILTGTVAWFMGYINEKKADGSIIPSWIIHALSNLFSGICAAFQLFS